MKINTFFSIAALAAAFILNTVQAQKKDITLEDIFVKRTFQSKGVWGIRSMNNGEHYTTLGSNKMGQYIVRYEYKTGNAVDTLLTSRDLRPEGVKLEESGISIEDYEFSSDESKILVASESEAIYRHSTRDNYYIYDLKSKKTIFISSGGKQMYADFSPDGSKVGFVRDNNLYLYDVATGKEKAITNDGKWNHIINGATDWVYEEEFSFDQAWHWSPDGSKIAFYRFDESKVKEFNMQKFGTLYPTDYRFKYPKAGEDNSTVEIFLYDVKTGQKIKADLGAAYEYIPRIQWASASQLSVQKLNRLQNKLELMLVDGSTGKSKLILTESSDTYLEINDNLTFLPNGKEFLWTSERDGFNHIYRYDMSGTLVNQLTSGQWEVTSIKGFSDKSGTVFYTSTEVSPMEKNLYSVGIDGKNKKRFSELPGTNDAQFNATYTYCIHSNAEANKPAAQILRNVADGSEIRVLEDNNGLQRKLSDYNLVKKEFFNFKTSGGTSLNGWMMKPAELKAGQKYPVLMFVYGGPGSNTVNNQWGGDFFWYQMLCSKGYIIVSVDNRGTGGRGKKFRDCTYRQLGKFETEDQIEAAKYLGGLNYIDKDRIGIWGWSYGGYMSSLCITKGADVFKMAMAVAPVTNWRYYDNIYTERYMGLPQDNGSGYDDNSPISHVDKIKGKYLLVHGTGDDNVHFQNTVEMTTAIQKANRQFTLMIYPDMNHGMGNNKGSGRYHLYQLMTEYILNNL